MEFFIPGNVPALKNGKQWTGKYLVSSQGVTQYLKSHNILSYSSSKKEVKHYKKGENSFEKVILEMKTFIKKNNLQPPYKFSFHFVRKSKHRFDFGNAIEILSDLFTSYKLIEDDNMDYFHPSVYYRNTQQGYRYDKDKPGVYIKILTDND